MAVQFRNTRNRSIWLVVASLVFVACVGLFISARTWSPVATKDVDSYNDDIARQPPLDPRLAASVEFPNVHPQVRFVADVECAKCHAEIARDYAQHPMGKSLSPAAQAEPIESWEANATTFQSQDYSYSVQLADGKPIHRETKLGADGRPLVTSEAIIDYTIGSGRNGRSYVFQRDGCLWMSPITWYPQKQTWDLSPGYEKRNAHFGRPVLSACLYCHANQTLMVNDSLNAYQPPIFSGHAIGCQRCHGPGELHVQKHEGGKQHDSQLAPESRPDPTIINPQRLQADARDAVCEQCHLSGTIRVARRGRDESDFRPGMLLSEFVSVFVDSNTHDTKFVGHVEQMHASRCFQNSNGRLACISCHDPHRRPSAAQMPEYFRARCLKCHQADDCHASVDQRTTTIPSDNCIACHMPTTATQVRHTAATDHTIPRRTRTVDGLVSPPTLPSHAAMEKSSLRPFHHLSAGDASEQQRDHAVAILMTSDLHPELITANDISIARRNLEAARQRDRADVAALEALGHAYWRTGAVEDAKNVFLEILQDHPRREFAWASLASLYQSQRDHRQAITAFRRAAEINPAHLKYHLELALSAAHLPDWKTCQSAAQRCLELNPANQGARQLFVESLLATEQLQAAADQFTLLLRLHPQQAAALQSWYDRHPLRRKTPRNP